MPGVEGTRLIAPDQYRLVLPKMGLRASRIRVGSRSLNPASLVDVSNRIDVSADVIKLACNAKVRDDLMLRAGVSYGRSPIDESVAFAKGLSVLTTEWHATVGLGWQVNKAWDVQIAYLHGFNSEVTDNGDDAGGQAEGTVTGLEVDSRILGVG